MDWSYVVAKLVYHLIFDDNFSKDKFVYVAQTFKLDGAGRSKEQNRRNDVDKYGRKDPLGMTEFTLNVKADGEEDGSSDGFGSPMDNIFTVSDKNFAVASSSSEDDDDRWDAPPPPPDGSSPEGCDDRLSKKMGSRAA